MGRSAVYNMFTVAEDAQKYVNAHWVLTELRRYQRLLTGDELKAIRNQALRGDVDGARDKLRMTVWARQK